MIKRLYTAFIIYMVMLYATPAYSINFFFSHLGVEDGLSQVSVLDIFQDSDGNTANPKNLHNKTLVLFLLFPFE